MVNTQNWPYGKMCQAPYHQPEGVTLRPCLRRSQKPKFQCLVLDDGPTPVWYEAEALTSLGACTTPNISERHSDAGGCSLRQILQAIVPEKYYLSPKACAGILRRAERRGKDLPPMLKMALERQASGLTATTVR